MATGSEQEITMLATLATLGTVVVGFAISIYQSFKQYRVSVRSVNRQAWINRLRELMAEFLQIHHVTSTLLRFATDSSRPPDIREKFAMENIERVSRSRFLLYHIELMLNPDEKEHVELLQLLKELNLQDNESVTRSKIDGILRVSKSAFKKEWEKVKKAV